MRIVRLYEPLLGGASRGAINAGAKGGIMTRIGSKLAVAAALLVVGVGTATGLSPEDKCEADKNKIAGKYAFCRQKAEAKAIKKSAAADYSKCDSKLSDKWGKAEQKAIDKGTTCMDAVSALDAQGFVTAHADAVAAALDGGALPTCGDASINVVGEQCDGVDLGGESCTTLGFNAGTLACDGGCAFDPAGCQKGVDLLVTGQTDCDQGAGTMGSCPGSPAGQDAAVGAGIAFSYSNNGDGTITDDNTGLMWEIQDFNPAEWLHHHGLQWDWYEAYNKIGVMNGNSGDCLGGTNPAACCSGVGTGTCAPFAGYSDWRLPNRRELDSLVDSGRVPLAIDPAFDTSCTGGCDFGTCSCTASAYYWSSTSFSPILNQAWSVDFGLGNVVSNTKSLNGRVRAVRGGL